MNAFFVFGSWRITSVGQVLTQVPQPIQPLISLMAIIFYFSSFLISGVAPLPAVKISPGGIIRGIVRAKDKPIALLLTGARHRIPMWAHKFCLISGTFSFAGRISLRRRTVMPSPGFCEGISSPNALTAMRIPSRVITMDAFFVIFIEKSPIVGFKTLSTLLY